MKKLMMLLMAIVLIATVSCKKEHTCMDVDNSIIQTPTGYKYGGIHYNHVYPVKNSEDKYIYTDDKVSGDQACGKLVTKP